MNASPLRAYWHREHLERVKRMVPPPKPIRLGPPPVAWAIIYNEAIGPDAPDSPILTLTDYLGALPPIKPMAPTLRRIQNTVAAYYKVGRHEMISPRRSRNLLPARFAYYYLAKTLTTHSIVKIGLECGGRDHCTVHNGLKRIKAQWETHAQDIRKLTNILDPSAKSDKLTL